MPIRTLHICDGETRDAPQAKIMRQLHSLRQDQVGKTGNFSIADFHKSDLPHSSAERQPIHWSAKRYLSVRIRANPRLKSFRASLNQKLLPVEDLAIENEDADLLGIGNIFRGIPFQHQKVCVVSRLNLAYILPTEEFLKIGRSRG